MKKIIFITFTILTITLGISKVSAQNEIIFSTMDYNYISRVEGETEARELRMLTVKGYTAYTLDPSLAIKQAYSEEDTTYLSNLTEEDLNYLKIVYSNGFDQDKPNNKMYMAAQELIWEYFSKKEVYWTDKVGNRIDIEKEKATILNKEVTIDKTPVIMEDSANGNYMEEVNIVDEANALSTYQVINKTENIVTKSKSKLSIKIKESGTIKLRKYLKAAEIHIYKPENSPYLFLFEDALLEKNIEITMNNQPNAYLKIQFKNGEKNAKEVISFKIDDDNTVYQTDENGSFLSKKTYLEGTYNIHDILSNSYDITDFDITVTQDAINDNQIVETKQAGTLKTGSIELYRFGKILDKKVPLEGVEYKLYAKENIKEGNETVYSKDEIITTVTTDKNGYVKIDNLNLGNYYLKETVKDYQTSEPILFEINQENRNIEKNITTDHNYLEINFISTTNYQYYLFKNDKLATELQEENKLAIEYGTYQIKVMSDDKLIYTWNIEFKENTGKLSFKMNDYLEPIIFTMPKTGISALTKNKFHFQKLKS